jgi:hypothetical protein
MYYVCIYIHPRFHALETYNCILTAATLCSRYVDTKFSDEYVVSIFKVKPTTLRTQSDSFSSDALNIILEKHTF